MPLFTKTFTWIYIITQYKLLWYIRTFYKHKDFRAKTIKRFTLT